MARRTAGEVKFSLAISWMVVFCRSTSRSISASTSSSGLLGQAITTPPRSRSRRSARPGARGGRRRRAWPATASRISDARPVGHDAAPHGQHVGVVVLAAQARREQVVAQRGPDPVDLVGGDLLALPGAAEHDPSVGLAPRRRPGRRRRRSAGSRPTPCRGCRGRAARGRGARARRRGAPSGRRRRGRRRSPPSRGALLRRSRPGRPAPPPRRGGRRGGRPSPRSRSRSRPTGSSTSSWSS